MPRDNSEIYSLIQPKENEDVIQDRYKIESPIPSPATDSSAISSIVETSPVTEDEIILTTLLQNQPEIVQMLRELTVEETIEVMTDINKKYPRKSRHPNGYYDISITNPSFNASNNGENVKFLPENSHSFSDRKYEGYHAYYNQPSNTIFMRQEQFSPESRLASWILGVYAVPGGETEEEVLEHETRHTIFRKNFRPFVDIRANAINEAFATAIIGGAFEDDIPSVKAEFQIEEDMKNLYFKVFRICQLLGGNEVRLVREMRAYDSYIRTVNDPETGRPQKQGMSTSDKQFLANIFYYLGIGSMEELDQAEKDLISDNEDMRKSSYEWKLDVWNIVYNKLVEKRPTIKTEWERLKAETVRNLRLRPDLSVVRRWKKHTPIKELVKKIAKTDNLFSESE